MHTPAFARELAEILLGRGVPVAIETCLAVAPRALEPFLGLPILWLADLKHVDAARFREATGGSLAQVSANMTTLAASGADLELRVPLVPGFNADDASIEAMLAFAAALPNPKGTTRRIDFLPYHELALGKYAMLDRECTWKGGESTVERRRRHPLGGEGRRPRLRDVDRRLTMTERIARIKDEILSTKPSICIERARIYTRVYKETESLPVVRRRAQALRRTLEEMTIWIGER